MLTFVIAAAGSKRSGRSKHAAWRGDTARFDTLSLFSYDLTLRSAVAGLTLSFSLAPDGGGQPDRAPPHQGDFRLRTCLRIKDEAATQRQDCGNPRPRQFRQGD